MPSSYRVIKNYQVDMGLDEFKVPIVPAHHLIKTGEEPLEEDGERDEIRDLIKNAQAEAEEIVQQAQIRAEQIKEDAYKQGYQEGLMQGREEGKRSAYQEVEDEVATIKGQAKDLLHQAHQKTREYIRETREEIIELSVTIARNIIHHNLDVQDEAIVGMINNALKHAEGKKQVIIRSSPHHNLLLETNLYQFKKICPNANFIILEDRGMEGANCIIETEDQVINLNIDLQLVNIEKALLEIGSEQKDDFSL